MKENQIGIPLEGFSAFTRKVASEGMVLLKNEEQMLPLKEGEHVAIFGRSQIDYYRNGTGSGGAVNVAYTVHILDGLRAQNGCVVDEILADRYSEWIQTHPYDNGNGAWAAEPWHQEEMPVTEELLCQASDRNQKAIVVIGRTAGEDQDNKKEEGSYLLTTEERALLQGVCRYFDQVAVLLNVSNIIDMGWMEEETIQKSLKAVLYIWQGASEGGNAVADILNGVVSPSGKLTDTIADCLEDYPSTKNYGHPYKNIYEEDIYVGYRYFETFAAERVKFPFGYGLSYTTFVIEPSAFHCDMERRELLVTGKVKNTGCVSGKEVVQIYIQPPQGQLGKPSKVLAGFCKTRCLEPGEEEIVSIHIPFWYIASYDDAGKTGRKSCFVMESGEYQIFMGNSSRADKVVLSKEGNPFLIGELLVLEQLEEALTATEHFQRLIPGRKREDGMFDMVYEQAPTRTIDLEKRIYDRLPSAIPYTGNQEITLRDVMEKRASMEAFLAQMSAEELAIIVRGEGMSSPKVTSGTAAAFGGVSDSLLDFGIPVACAADGPSGIRMEGGGKATQLPIGTLLAATWNTPLVEELYEWEGREMVQNHIDTLLGPGLNIRRNPLNGRNFEYYSEDPLVSGMMAAAAVRGIRKGGGEATLKHFACNNQEEGRTTAEAVVSERALREIYLKGFEIAIKEGEAHSVMSSYNPLNGYWTASNYDLLTTILREEWGFTGIVMTDWWAKMNHVIKGGEPSTTYTGYMLRAQNDIYMVVSNNGAEVNASQDDTLHALQRGELTIGELQRAAGNICNFIMKCLAFRTEKRIQSTERIITPIVDGPDTTIIGDKLQLSEKDMSRGFEVDQEGVFDVLIRCRCMGNNQMQAASNILLNKQEINILQTNGTDGKWIIQKLTKVSLAKGYYKPSIESLKEGIQIEWIEFIRKN